MNTNEKRHFNSCAPNYETEIGEEYPQWLKWHLIEKHVPAGRRVADIGGANGRHAIDAARKLSCEVICVDLSEGMLQQLKTRAGLSEDRNTKSPFPVVAKAQEIPISDSSVDAAWCYATLLLMPDQKTAISEIVRIVRPGGIIILDIGNIWNLGWVYWRRFYKKLGFPGIFPLSLRRSRKLASALGCEIIENTPTGLLSQLLYLPLVDKRTNLREKIHAHGRYPDLDGRWSSKVPFLANRYYLVLRKKGD